MNDLYEITTPIEKLNSIEWKKVEELCNDSNLPYATHHGVMRLLDMELKCYRLNDGRTIIDADDMRKFFGLDL